MLMRQRGTPISYSFIRSCSFSSTILSFRAPSFPAPAPCCPRHIVAVRCSKSSRRRSPATVRAVFRAPLIPLLPVVFLAFISFHAAFCLLSFRVSHILTIRLLCSIFDLVYALCACARMGNEHSDTCMGRGVSRERWTDGAGEWGITNDRPINNGKFPVKVCMHYSLISPRMDGKHFE